MTYEKTLKNSTYVFFQYDEYVDDDPNIPDLIEEAMYELDWMLKMQIKSGDHKGEVYHKVTSATYPEITVLPQNDNLPLYVSPTSYAATADFAAVMAYAYRLVKDIPGLSDKAATYLQASIDAFNALYDMENEEDIMEKVSFKNPEGIEQGEYPDSDLDDELAWAAAEIAASTYNPYYADVFNKVFDSETDLGFGWANVNGFAAYTFIRYLGGLNDQTKAVAKKFLAYADTIVGYSEEDVYNVTVGTKTIKDEKTGGDKEVYAFEWGSNLTVAGNGILLDLAVDLLSNLPSSLFDLEDSDIAKRITKYTKVKQQQLNYLLGDNACAYCFVTGYGTLTPENPHHRPSVANGKAMKGMLVGGPDSNFASNGADTVATRNCQGYAEAHCYIDNNNSWSTNEVTIYWNSPFIYLLVSTISDELGH